MSNKAASVSAGGRGLHGFHTAVGRSEDHRSTWWAAWSSEHRSGGRTEPGQASSGPGDIADICTYSPWALRAHWGGTLVRWRHSPRISEPFFSINLTGDPAKWRHHVRAAHQKEEAGNVNDRCLWLVVAKFNATERSDSTSQRHRLIIRSFFSTTRLVTIIYFIFTTFSKKMLRVFKIK